MDSHPWIVQRIAKFLPACAAHELRFVSKNIYNAMTDIPLPTVWHVRSLSEDSFHCPSDLITDIFTVFKQIEFHEKFFISDFLTMKIINRVLLKRPFRSRELKRACFRLFMWYQDRTEHPWSATLLYIIMRSGNLYVDEYCRGLSPMSHLPYCTSMFIVSAIREALVFYQNEYIRTRGFELFECRLLSLPPIYNSRHYNNVLNDIRSGYHNDHQTYSQEFAVIRLILNFLFEYSDDEFRRNLLSVRVHANASDDSDVILQYLRSPGLANLNDAEMQPLVNFTNTCVVSLYPEYVEFLKSFFIGISEKTIVDVNNPVVLINWRRGIIPRARAEGN